MIDIFALGLTHALMALAAWRLMARADLDREGAPEEPRRKSWQRVDESEAGDA
jgi:hypothetical protein